MRTTHATAFVALMVGALSFTEIYGHTVTADALRIRSGPGFQYGVRTLLDHGTVVNTVKTSGNWTYIDKPSRGWVYTKYLANRPHQGGGSPGGGSSTSVSHAYGNIWSGWMHCPGSFQGGYGYYESYKRWGRPRVINGILILGRKWASLHPGKHIGIGDISVYGGGYTSGHVSHRRGLDFDSRAMTRSATAGYVLPWYGSYSTYYTQQYINLIRRIWSPICFILHNNSRLSGVSYWPNHANHIHTRIVCY